MFSKDKAAIALGIFAKWPEPGFAKTRLIPSLGSQGAAEVARALLIRTLDWARTLQEDQPSSNVRVWTDHGSTDEWNALLQPYRFTHQAQRGAHLGEKMAYAMQQQLQGGARSMIVGTDTPTLSAEKVMYAANQLNEYTSVFIPALDGGYVLIGLREFTPAPFEHIDWGTERVAEQTRSALDRSGATHQWCDPEPDLDTPEDYHLAIKNKWL